MHRRLGHGAASQFSPRKNKTPSALADGVLEFNLDDDLLSHGETPHYHRRCTVSLLSSGWDQVVPMLYGRQEIRVPSRGLRRASANRVCDQVELCCKLSVAVVFTVTAICLVRVADCLGVIWSSLTGN